MSGDVPGYSLSQQELNDLKAVGIEPAPPSNPGPTARLLADQHLRRNPEPAMDHRLRSGSIEQHHRDEVAKLLHAAGYTGDVARAARSVPQDADVVEAVKQLLATQPPPPPARSAEQVLNRRL